MTRTSESAPSTQHRLRRIEGRHNAVVKELRQAFARAERTEDGSCAVEGAAHCGRGYPQRPALSSGVLQRVGAESGGAPAAPDRRQRRHAAASRQTFRRHSPHRNAAGSGGVGSTEGILSGRRAGAAAGRPGHRSGGTAGSRQSGDDPALGRSLWQRGRSAGRGHGQSL